jgi:hypothetical protein
VNRLLNTYPTALTTGGYAAGERVRADGLAG